MFITCLGNKHILYQVLFGNFIICYKINIDLKSILVVCVL
jgi:hypothetical protein